MTSTANLKLPYLAANQAQKHVTINESLRMLDVLVQLSVLSRTLTAPPATPGEGERFIIPSAATGAWAGRSGQIAAYQDGGWTYYVPFTGWHAFVAGEQLLVSFDGTNWTEAAGFQETVTKLGINAVADTTNRLSVSAQATLLNHQGNGHQLKVNKAAAGDTASLLFQTGFSGRAEIGLTGNDDLALKTSTNGSSWSTTLVAKNDTGRIGLNIVDPQERLHIAGNFRMQDSAAFIGFYNSTGTIRTGYLQAHASAGFYLAMEQNLPMHFYTNNQLRMSVMAGGDVGIGTASPTTKLQIAGPVRIGNYNKASLPSAGATGSGTVLYVADEAGGAVLAFSDGSNWRRVTDRAIVS